MVEVKDDLTGKVFGLLTVLEQAEDYIAPSSGKHYAKWRCQCECENKTIIEVMGCALTRTNGTKSCGCIKKATSSEHCKNMRKFNTYDVSGKYGIGWTLNTHAEFYFDLEDYDIIKKYCWHERIDDKDGYHVLCSRNENGKIIKMSSLLGYKYYDHIDRNPLNNRKSNLRPATMSENMSNRSLFKNNKSGITGVWWDDKREKWIAYIRKDNKQNYLGSFINKNDAIRARLNAEVKYFGEFAPQQHLFEQYNIIIGD